MIGSSVGSHIVTVEFEVIAHSRQQAELFVQAAAVNPFKQTRRGTGRIVPNSEQKESAK